MLNKSFAGQGKFRMAQVMSDFRTIVRCSSPAMSSYVAGEMALDDWTDDELALHQEWLTMVLAKVGSENGVPEDVASEIDLQVAEKIKAMKDETVKSPE